MIIHSGYNDLNLNSTVVTLGIFDGVHKGHMVLLNHLVTSAASKKCESAVITFSPHPREVLEPSNSGLAFLSTTEEKIALLEKAGIDHLIIIQFTKEFSAIPACDFIKDILHGKIGTRHLVIGFNHHFGKGGEGDLNTIKKCSEELGFVVEQVGGFKTPEGTVSSSVIRNALLKGDLDAANRWLGYDYSVSGKVIEGRKLGRTIGFPTANIRPSSPNKLIPRNGVYAVEVKQNNTLYPGMLNIGSNPTVNTDSNFRSIEVNILNFDRDIYGQDITVFFRKRLRDEKKFESLEELTAQMELDRQNTLEMFKK